MQKLSDSYRREISSWEETLTAAADVDGWERLPAAFSQPMPEEESQRE